MKAIYTILPSKRLYRVAFIMTATILTSSCLSAPKEPTLISESHEWNSGSKEYSESRQRMRQKFGKPGFQLVVDAFDGQDFHGVEFFPNHHDNPFYASSLQNLNTQSVMSLPGEIPDKIRITIRKSADKPIWGKYGQTTYADPIIGDFIIPFGERIPEELVKYALASQRGIRFKIRLSNDGPYFGWDISSRPGYKPNTNLWYPPCYVMTGGDFKEARNQYYRETPDGRCEPVRPYIREKGWYIDKKTGQRIETDF